MSKLIIFGIGQTAEIIHYYFKNDSEFEVVGFTADSQYILDSEINGLPVFDFESIEKTHPPDEYKMFVALGYSELNKIRAGKYAEAKKKGYELISYISSKTNKVGSCDIGDNCLILENQCIQPFAKIGCNVFIWSGALIGHHSVIGDHCWITSHASIGGNAFIGDYCFLGMNSTVSNMVTIGNECFVGANTLITKDSSDKSVFIVKDTDRYMLDSDKFLKITKMR